MKTVLSLSHACGSQRNLLCAFARILISSRAFKFFVSTLDATRQRSKQRRDTCGVSRRRAACGRAAHFPRQNRAQQVHRIARSHVHTRIRAAVSRASCTCKHIRLTRKRLRASRKHFLSLASAFCLSVPTPHLVLESILRYPCWTTILATACPLSSPTTTLGHSDRSHAIITPPARTLSPTHARTLTHMTPR